MREILAEAKAAYRRANPAYEEMEGIVAGVSTLADYDVIIDAGSAGDDPENAVPFDLELPNGKTLEQPGNFMFLTETALYGTNDALLAKGAKADLDGNGKVDFGEALPDAGIFLATTRDFDRYARELDSEAAEFEPTEADAFSALVVMTPTMSEYFEAWKNSRFVAGGKASEQAFVATSRLSDIADILEGLVFTYDGVRPLVARADRAAGAPDRPQSGAAGGLRGRAARQGGGRPALQRRGGRHPRYPGPAAGGGDRRAAHPGGGQAEHRARGRLTPGVRALRALGLALGALLAVARPRGRPRRRAALAGRSAHPGAAVRRAERAAAR